MSSSPLYFITTANGATGSAAVQELVSQGRRVRAFVRKEDERSERLRSLPGVEIFVGDLSDFQTVRASLDGVTGVYFCYPLVEDLVQSTAFFAEAAKEKGVQHIVNMSQYNTRRDPISKTSQAHWVAEQVLTNSGVPTTHLRPGLFSEWITYPFSRLPIVNDNLLALPFNGTHAPISASDIGLFAAHVLLNPSAHVGKVYKMAGPQEIGFEGMAAALTKHLGRTITYRAIDSDTFSSLLRSKGFSDLLIQHFQGISEDYRAGLFRGMDNFISQTIGRPLQTVDEFVLEHLSLWKQQ